MVTNNKPQFQHPATPILDEILSCICPHHKPAMLLETQGTSMTLITYSGSSLDGGKVIGFKGWVVSALITLTQAIGEAQKEPAKFELYLPPNKDVKPSKTPAFNRKYDATKVRKILASLLELLIDGQCVIDEIRTVASITLTIQPFVPLDHRLVVALNTICHTIAMASGYPKLTVQSST